MLLECGYQLCFHTRNVEKGDSRNQAYGLTENELGCDLFLVEILDHRHYKVVIFLEDSDLCEKVRVNVIESG
jgi:hypothetical protein